MSSEDPNAAGSGANEPGGQAGQGQGEGDSVSHESYRKLLDQRKADQRRMKEMQQQLDGLNQDRLRAEGDKDKLIDDLTRKLKASNESKQSIVYNSVKNQVETRAKAMGAKHPDLVLMAAGDRLTELTDGLESDLQLDMAQVDGMLEDIRKERDGLFSSDAPKAKNITPSIGDPAAKRSDEKSKTVDDLFAELRS